LKIETLKSWYIALLIGLLTVGTARAQYIPAFRPLNPVDRNSHGIYWHKGNLFRHLEVSLTAGTTGFGLDVATPLSQYVQVRAGYDYMPRLKKRIHASVTGGDKQAVTQAVGNGWAEMVDLDAKLTLNNAKLLVDVYPLKYNKNWHVTAGIYYGPAEFSQVDEALIAKGVLQKMKKYGVGLDMGYPLSLGEDATVHVQTYVNSFKPFIGFGYGGRLIPDRADWKVTVECGAMFWGGTPQQIAFDGTDLSRVSQRIPNGMGTWVRLNKLLKVYPVLSVRFAKTLF